jgi:hypothetical protein
MRHKHADFIHKWADMDDYDEGYLEGFADCGWIGLVVVVLVIVCTVLVMR